MSNFQHNMNALIEELEPMKAITSHKFYDFSQFEQANVSQLPCFLKVGLLYNNSIALPALVPFIDSKGLVYLYNNVDEEHAKLYIQNLLFELIGKISPNKIDIIIYDPVYLGVPFRYICQVALDNVSIELLTDEKHLLSRLQKYVNYSQEFISNKLLNFNSFIDYWEKSNDSQKQYTIFVLNDSNFSRNASITDIVNRIIANTKNNNSFFILSDLDSKKENFAFFNPEYFIENLTPFYDELYITLEYQNLKQRIHENLSVISAKQKEKSGVIETYDIRDGIKIPIGLTVNNKKPHYFTFGHDTDSYNAIIGGQPGKGKSNLLRTIINRGKENYSNEELRFMLFDCKSTELEEYKNDPYVIECECTLFDINIVLEKLKTIEQEFEKRAELMRQHKVRDINGLLDKGVKIYRVICIIDEFQKLFTSSMKQADIAKDLLVNKMIKTGRSFGIHLVLATQSLGDGVDPSILNNIPLRIALGMTPEQSSKFLGWNNDSAKNLEKGLAVYNNNNGDKDANKLVKIDKAD